MLEPSLECEIAFCLRTDLDGADPGLSDAAVVDAIGSCHLACEIIDNRYGDPLRVGVPSLLADDFFHAGFVIGAAKQDWQQQDFTALDAAIEIDGARATGNASNVLSALDAMRWLLRKLASTAERLRAGDIILTGSIVPPTRMTLPARSVTLSIQGFEPLLLGQPG